MGVGMAGVGMNVMHDGNHGSYSNKKWVNKLMGSSIYILAGNVYNWKVQHNVLHHTYTNIHGHDEDFEAGRILRFSQTCKWHKFHKFQHYYSIFLYGLIDCKLGYYYRFPANASLYQKKIVLRKIPKSLFTNWSINWLLLN